MGKKETLENVIKKDYGNRISDFGLFTSKAFAKYFKIGMNGIFGSVDKMVNE